jgi:hypothetical protein
LQSCRQAHARAQSKAGCLRIANGAPPPDTHSLKRVRSLHGRRHCGDADDDDARKGGT